MFIESTGDKLAWQIEKIDDVVYRKCPVCGTVFQGLSKRHTYCGVCGTEGFEGVLDENELRI